LSNPIWPSANHAATQSSGTVSGSVVLRNYVSAICRSATDILHQAAVLVAGNYRLFEAASKIIATEITGLLVGTLQMV